jgi:hypothetical protein
LIADKPENIVHMCSSKKKSRNQNNDSNKRGEYWKVVEVSSQMREAVIKLYTEKVIANAAVNGGSCRPGLVN